MSDGQSAPQSAPILVFSEGISYCHIIRPLVVARWLRALERPIVVACPAKARQLFEDDGFQTIEIRTADPVAIYNRLARGSYIYEKADLVEYYTSDRRLLDELAPSLVLVDFRFPLLHLAAERGVPSVGLTSASCHPYFPLSKSTPNAFIRPTFVPVGVFDRLHDSWIGQRVQSKVIAALSRNYRDASREAGLEPLPDFFHYASQGDLCLLCDHPDVMPLPRLREHDLYTGALVWTRDDPLPAELEQLRPERRKVYVTIGTQESLDVSFLAPLVRSLVDEDFVVIISKGRRDIELAFDHPDVHVVDFVNEGKLLPMVDLYIYHGSAMSTYQGLHAGKPMISIPCQADQHYHSEALERLGVGTLFRPVELDTDELIETAHRLLNSSQVAEQVAAVAARLRSFTARNEVVSRVRGLLERAD